MIIGIDASNLRRGGGVTHLIELLASADPERYGFSKVIVWGNRQALAKITDKPWLEKAYDPWLEKNLFYRQYWQRFKLNRLLRTSGCSILFAPGGSESCSFRPMVTMCRNMLPFEFKEIKRYGFSLMRLRLLILHFTQKFSFSHATGLIFLTEYARKEVSIFLHNKNINETTIAHGINQRFFMKPRKQKELKMYSIEKPLKLLYVSIIDLYKHQWTVAEAVADLRQNGFPLQLDLVGPFYKPALRKLTSVLNRIDSDRKFIKYHGNIPYENLHELYKNSELFIFASSCENMPNILLEAMASGLPIACSSRGPMPEVLGDRGLYFDPEDKESIKKAVMDMIKSKNRRESLAMDSIERAKQYSWDKTAAETFDFLKNTIELYNKL